MKLNKMHNVIWSRTSQGKQLIYKRAHKDATQKYCIACLLQISVKDMLLVCVWKTRKHLSLFLLILSSVLRIPKRQSLLEKWVEL